ncbi:hypothetical protein BDP27DRAFT_1317072 [Rhodocollybia butyracea]|uniref:Non-specific serine/threonine protein kinase n=1 Tax=Rhodocollybia butyracea TaxID=206335 RepID=A0A9P5UCS3_9AGAR|nr:hypothetical protein BDP27DRAFT_1317072 [Rhodocollybia butyracea]
MIRAPSDQLRFEATKILARLALIIEFRPWINPDYRQEPPYRTLYECFSLGRPLGVLLDLLGSPAPSHFSVHIEDFDFDLSLPEREQFIQNFIQRIQLLEAQGRISYGEVLRVEDVLNGTSSGFMKVLKTVTRILCALQDSYPGLFVLPEDAELKVIAAIQELVESERIHVEFLRMVVDHAAFLSLSTPIEAALESIVINNQRLQQYHDRVLSSFQQIELDASLIQNWETIFAFDDHSVRNNMASTYRSLCTSYVSLYEYFDRIISTLEPVIAAHSQMLLDVLCYIPSRIESYSDQLQTILSLTLPTPAHQSYYDSLCNTILKMRDISSGIDEMSSEVRTLRAVRILKGRAFRWRSASGGSIDPSDMGRLILDDQLQLEDTETTSGSSLYQIFLFEAMLLCCLDGSNQTNNWDDEGWMSSARYPIRAWELGPALKRAAPLNLVYAIPTNELQELRLFGSDEFELEWNRNPNLNQGRRQSSMTLSFTCPFGEDQYNQWCSVLERFVHSVIDCPIFSSTSPHVGYEVGEDEGHADADIESLVLSEDSPNEDLDFVKMNFGLTSTDGRRHSHPRPWSLIARKGPHSESSSLHQQMLEEDEQEVEDVLRDVVGFSSIVMPPPLPLKKISVMFEINDSERVLDFTGQITLIGGCAVAGGGYSDVWRAILNTRKDGRGQEVKVAVKVIRSHYGDAESETILKRRLAREMDVWKQLKHPNILPLYGTTSGFGPYDSLVCPWMENGSASRYMEKWGDIMSMTDRLQLVIHSHGIVHGDLTGSNILIDDNRQACLCDFGLSNIISEVHGAFSNHSTMSGAIRWADATLFITQTTQMESESDEQVYPVLTNKSDIYSFGSVTLEILSGRIPYHYIRNDAQVIFEMAKGRKPRRPTASFVTDAQWDFIFSRCWCEDPILRPDAEEVVRIIQVLLRSSLEFRRHTGSAWDSSPVDKTEEALSLDKHLDVVVNSHRRHSEPLQNG